MNWKEILIREYAGHPLRVVLNLLIIAGIGILVGHLVFGAPLSDRLVMGAMVPGLVAIVAAAILKEDRYHGPHY